MSGGVLGSRPSISWRTQDGGVFIKFLHLELHRRKLSRVAVEEIVKRNKLCPADMFVMSRGQYEFEPRFWEAIPGVKWMDVPGHKISLQTLARATIGKSKLGKGANAPELFAARHYRELVAYCQNDVQLTRDIFLTGSERGEVQIKRMSIPVRWAALAKALVSRKQKLGPIYAAQCLEYGYKLTLSEPHFYPVENLFRKEWQK
jgi:hypothetical protein